MGANSSKDLPADIEILAALSKKDGGVTNDYSDLLLDPIVKRKYSDLYQLVQHNSMNDMNHLTRVVAEFQKEKLPVLLQLSKIYSTMLTQVEKMQPELKTETERFQFLGEDANLVKFFYWQSGSGSPSVATMLTGQESPDILRSLQSFVGDLRVRDAKLRYFQFKYAQAMLFQAAFTQTMWVVASAFVQSTQAFHRVRETAFGSVFKQMSSIVQKYTGADDVRLEDVDKLDKLTKKLSDVKKLAEVRDKLESKKLTSIKDLLQDLINMDSEITADPSKLLPVPPGLMSGIEMTPSGTHSIQYMKPTGYVHNLPPPVPSDFGPDGANSEEYKKQLKLYENLNMFIQRSATSPENNELLAYFANRMKASGSSRHESNYGNNSNKKKKKKKGNNRYSNRYRPPPR